MFNQTAVEEANLIKVRNQRWKTVFQFIDFIFTFALNILFHLRKPVQCSIKGDQYTVQFEEISTLFRLRRPVQAQLSQVNSYSSSDDSSSASCNHFMSGSTYTKHKSYIY